MMKTKHTIRQLLATLAFCGFCLATAYAVVIPPPLLFTSKLNGNKLTVSWLPLGCTLQTQTTRQGTGLGTNWVAVPGSQVTTNMVFIINQTNPAVFFRLVVNQQ